MSHLVLVTGFTLFPPLPPRRPRARVMLYLASCSQIPQVSNTCFIMNEPMGFMVLMLFKCLKRSFSNNPEVSTYEKLIIVETVMKCST